MNYDMRNLGYPRTPTDAKLILTISTGERYSIPLQALVDSRDAYYEVDIEGTTEDTVGLIRAGKLDYEDLMDWYLWNVNWADIKDYEFQLVDKTVKKGDAVIAVRLIHKADGKPVSDAVIFATRLDMAPDGMETMKTTIEAMPSTEPGVYRFKAAFTMEGGWQLSLGAKVQGESGTVETKLVLKATP